MRQRREIPVVDENGNSFHVTETRGGASVGIQDDSAGSSDGGRKKYRLKETGETLDLIDGVFVGFNSARKYTPAEPI